VGSLSGLGLWGLGGPFCDCSGDLSNRMEEIDWIATSK
jgi:hypothetical protein